MGNNQKIIVKSIATLIFTLSTFLAHSFVTPILKRQIDIKIKTDTANHTSSEMRVYSYTMIDKNGSLGTYTEKKTFNKKGNVISRTQTKRNIPFLGCKEVHTIISQKTDYNSEGKVSKIHKSKRMSNGLVVMKDVSITYSDSGKKVKQNNLKSRQSIEGYQRPNYFQVRAHRLKK